MRKLASIRKISEVLEHPNADALELAVVDGWQCVVAKGKHKAGEDIIYFEIDSVLPVWPEYEFLRKSCHIKKDWLPEGEGLRIKTIRLRKELSQGLVMAIDVIFDPKEFGFEAGEDLTKVLNVVKYDPPVPANLAGLAKGKFPEFIPKTDQNRVQNCFNKMKALKHDWEVTMKLEGSSMTVYKDLAGIWGVCSRNADLKIDEDNKENAFVKMFNELMKNTDIAEASAGLAFQGELMGAGIQGNIEGFRELRFYVYDIWSIADQSYLNSRDRQMICNDLGLRHTPILMQALRMKDQDTLQDFLSLADGPSINAVRREGIVFKSLQNPNKSFKAISNQYLLKQKD